MFTCFHKITPKESNKAHEMVVHQPNNVYVFISTIIIVPLAYQETLVRLLIKLW